VRQHDAELAIDGQLGAAAGALRFEGTRQVLGHETYSTPNSNGRLVREEAR